VARGILMIPTCNADRKSSRSLEDMVKDITDLD
jgi:hypothetical protein